MNTIFSKIIQGGVEAAFVYQDDLVSAFMDVQPINPGHVLVVTNQEVTSLAELDEEIGIHLFRIAHRIALALRKSAIKCEGVNIFVLDGEAAGQEVSHVHIHVVPRFSGDGYEWKLKQDLKIAPKEEIAKTAAMISSVLDPGARQK